MMKVFQFLIYLSCIIHSQALNELHSLANVRKFADHLFDEKDYLRSIYEFERYLKYVQNDTVEFKIAVGYQQIRDYDSALERFLNINNKSVFLNKSVYEYYKTLLLAEKFEVLQDSLNNENSYRGLLYLSYLFTSDELPDQQKFSEPFPADAKNDILNFYNQKKSPPYKSSLLSGLMSAIIPGSGKIYLGETGDGITAFIVTTLLVFLSYDNFSHNHNFRGWLFSGIGLFFYSSNIYGSVSEAQIYNARVDYEYNASLREYLNNKNYFLPRNEFNN